MAFDVGADGVDRGLGRSEVGVEVLERAHRRGAAEGVMKGLLLRFAGGCGDVLCCEEVEMVVGEFGNEWVKDWVGGWRKKLLLRKSGISLASSSPDLPWTSAITPSWVCHAVERAMLWTQVDSESDVIAPAVSKSHVLQVVSGCEGVHALSRMLQGMEMCRVQELRLDNVHLDMSSIKALSSALSASTNFLHLSTISLSQCKLGDDGLTELEPALSALPSLQKLDLSQNRLTMDSGSSLRHLISTCDSMLHLNVRMNTLGFRGMGEFRDVLLHSHLHSLSMGFNGLRDDGTHSFLSSLVKQTEDEEESHLEVLDLEHSGIRLSGARSLGLLLPKLHSLRKVLLAYNRIGDTEMEELFSFLPNETSSTPSTPSFPSHPSSSSSDSGDSWAGSESGGGVLENVQVLDLRANGIGVRGMAVLGRALQHAQSFPALHSLLLPLNWFGSEGALVLADAFASSPLTAQLRTIDLGGNLIGEEAASALLQTLLTHAPSLQALSLAGNNLDASSFFSLATPPPPHSLSDLHSLILSRNNISDDNALRLPHALSTLAPNLTLLDLSDNKISTHTTHVLQSLHQLPHIKTSHE